MRLGHVTHTWGDQDLEKILKEITQIGYEGVEVFDYDLEPYYNQSSKFEALLGRYNLELTSVYVEVPFIKEEKIDEEMKKALKAAEFMLSFGTKHMIAGPGPMPEGGLKKEKYKLMADSLNKLGKQCLKKGVNICFHPHVGGTVENREQIGLIFELTNPNYVFFVPDTGHLAKGGSDPCEVVRTYLDRIRFVHLKDMKDSTFVELGRGDIDNKGVMEIIKETGYSGWVLPEIPVREGTPAESAIVSYDFLKALMKELQILEE